MNPVEEFLLPALQVKSMEDEKHDSIRIANICAAKSVADAVRTSLGPRGMDKMIQTADGEVTITNHGATILKQMSVIHPTARMVRIFLNHNILWK
uniref:Uncharacterized protein n=1 Tax=Panagrolaimus davidi TaxID=227884 RepID=A0A914PES8_9BILA